MNSRGGWGGGGKKAHYQENKGEKGNLIKETAQCRKALNFYITRKTSFLFTIYISVCPEGNEGRK